MLLAGALGVWYDTAGDVIGMWNLMGAFGLIIVAPAVMLSAIGSGKLRSPNLWELGRGYATAGLGLVMTFCLLMVWSAIGKIVAPSPRDPTSWTPVLSNGEQVVVAVPYTIMLAIVLSVLVDLWRRGSDGSPRSSSAASPGT
jgi:hypothetical protein